MPAVIYLFAGFLAGHALARELLTRSSRRGKETPTGCEHVWGPWGELMESRVGGNPEEEHPSVIVCWQSRVCLNCNEMDYRYVA